MPNFVRKSLFRHVFGQPYKKEKQFESVPITRVSTDSNMCAANPQFVAIITEASGGGSFLVLPLEQFGRVDINAPRVCGHKSSVLDIAWCPHNDNVIASCSEDSSIKVWYIPDDGLKEPITEAEQTLNGHQKKVLSIEWNPAAENILLSYAQDEPLFIWNVVTGEALITVEHPSSIFSASWSPTGDLIGTTCKDKQLRIIDARSGEVKQIGKGFEGGKPQKIKMLKNNRAFAVGMSRMGQRQYKLYATNDLSKPIEEESVDNGSNTFNIFYDEDLSMIYLVAKGDCKLLYYEIDEEEPYVHYLALYIPKEASKGLGWMPKRGLNLNEHEVARFYRLKDKGGCEPCSMIVPRKSELFQADVYPPCVSLDPAMTADEWLNGANKPRPTVDMEQFFKGSGPAAPKAMRSNRLGRSSAPASGEAAKPTPASSALSRRSEPASRSSGESNEHSEPPPAPSQNAIIDKDIGTPPKVTPVSSPPSSTENSLSEELPKKGNPPSLETPPVKPQICSPKPGSSDTPNNPNLQSLLDTFKELRSSVTEHGGRLSYLEDLTTEQKKQIEDLIKEVEKLKETVKEQEDRIAALEAQEGEINGN